VLWDLAHLSVEDVCITWRKGLKRVWKLPTRTHSGLVAPLCGLLPLRFELACRCSRFIVKCLNSSNSIVRFVAGQGVLHHRMHSPIGRNAQHSATLQCQFSVLPHHFGRTPDGHLRRVARDVISIPKTLGHCTAFQFGLNTRELCFRAPHRLNDIFTFCSCNDMLAMLSRGQ